MLSFLAASMTCCYVSLRLSKGMDRYRRAWGEDKYRHTEKQEGRTQENGS